LGPGGTLTEAIKITMRSFIIAVITFTLFPAYIGQTHDESAGEILTRPWGERSFYAEDPYGNLLCFVDERTVFTGN
jgi:hypothetical protein